MNENNDRYKIVSALFDFKQFLILLNKIKLQNPIKKTGDRFNKNKSDFGRLNNEDK